MFLQIEMKVKHREANLNGLCTITVDADRKGCIIDHDSMDIQWDDESFYPYELSPSQEEKIMQLAYENFNGF